MSKDVSNSLQGAWRFVRGSRDEEPGPPMEAVFTFDGDRLLIAATENGVKKNLS